MKLDIKAQSQDGTKLKTKVCNLIGGPGIGKSVLASELFVKMKKNHINCELIYEYPKEVTWEENEKLLKNQIGS